ncbi:hypothetical protein LEP1GSC188_3757 [Leptospira weilii serovar Topaz str. LT2116]|uniref:Uncharacterized protein n=1 Tax=Leptospira weilii serovar Topaz str. LT2116 TaxID=1088540 RepID=M3GUN9_9LEPT|nr:hypothetical protein [Leptospira weilii]EMF80586.1 hypothetical protein LEP1GSC188_3757 [Leptospira weilii serovar Topaz str. LT2116]
MSSNLMPNVYFEVKNIDGDDTAKSENYYDKFCVSSFLAPHVKKIGKIELTARPKIYGSDP